MSTQQHPTGLFFGSFNPIHSGHLMIAQYMLAYGSLEQLWFVVTPQSPFKAKKSLLDNYQRLEMVNRAIGDHPGMRAIDIEFRLPQPNYTVNTLSALTEKYPERSFELIMGSDNLLHFEKWRNYQYILDHYRLIVYPRPGIPDPPLMSHPSVRIVEAPLIEISASFIRESIAAGKDMHFFVPEAAYSYIREMHFYE
jgi:nicotinate-nucleotide adenylyltransferase